MTEIKKYFFKKVKLYEAPLIVISVAFGAWYCYYQGRNFLLNGLTSKGVVIFICTLFLILLPALALILPYTKYNYLKYLNTPVKRILAIAVIITVFIIRRFI